MEINESQGQYGSQSACLSAPSVSDKLYIVQRIKILLCGLVANTYVCVSLFSIENDE